MAIHGALAHAAGVLERILVDALLGVGMPTLASTSTAIFQDSRLDLPWWRLMTSAIGRRS